MEEQVALYNLKDAAHILGVHRDTISYWEKKKLIPLSKRNEKNNYRVFTYADVVEIAKIRGIAYLNPIN